MTRTHETMILKSSYVHNDDRTLLSLDYCNDVQELTDLHVYKRTAKRSLYENEDLKVDDIYTVIIITDYDLNEDDEIYKECFYEDININCFDLDYNTIDYKITQLS